jgi:hypothetical protein
MSEDRQRKDPQPLLLRGADTPKRRDEPPFPEPRVRVFDDGPKERVRTAGDESQPRGRASGGEPPLSFDRNFVVPPDLRAHQGSGSTPFIAIAAFIVFCLGGGAFAFWKYTTAEDAIPPRASSATASMTAPARPPLSAPPGDYVNQPATQTTVDTGGAPEVKTPPVPSAPSQPVVDQAEQSREQAARRVVAEAQRQKEQAEQARRQAQRQAAEEAQRQKEQAEQARRQAQRQAAEEAQRQKQQAEQARQQAQHQAAEEAQRQKQQADQARQQAERQAAEKAQQDRAEKLRLAEVRQHQDELRAERQRREAAARRAREARAQEEQAVEEQMDQEQMDHREQMNQEQVDHPPMNQADAGGYEPPSPPAPLRARREQDANLPPEPEAGEAPPLDASDLPPRASVNDAEDRASDPGVQASDGDDQ